MIAYTGIETISNMAEEAKDEAQDDPGRDQPRADRGVRHLLHAAGRRAQRAAGDAATPSGEYVTLLGLPEEEGGYAGDPILGVVKSIDLGPLQGAGRALRRPARRDDPLHRDERGHHRRLAARLLDGHPPPAARPAAPAAPEVRHAVDRDPHLRRRRVLILLPGQADFLGNLYAFGAMLSFTIAHIAVIRLRITEPDARAAVPRAGQRPLPRPRPAAVRGRSAGSATASAFVVVTVLHLDVAISGVVLARARHRRLRPATAAARGST